MFSRNKTKLTVVVTDQFIIESDKPNLSMIAAGCDKYDENIHSMSELSALHDTLKKQHHDAFANENRIHEVSFEVSGTISGKNIKNLKLNSLNELNNFIADHSPTHSVAKPSMIGILSPF